MSTTSAQLNYNLSVAPGLTGAIATSFIVTATATGGQAKDITCPVFTVSDTGVRTPDDSVTGCWH